MSHDFFFALGDSDASLLATASAATAQAAHLTILGSDADRVTLRWMVSPQVGAQEPDVEVFRHEDGVVVSFHAANRSQRKQFVKDLAMRFETALGHPVDFDEV